MEYQQSTNGYPRDPPPDQHLDPVEHTSQAELEGVLRVVRGLVRLARRAADPGRRRVAPAVQRHLAGTGLAGDTARDLRPARDPEIPAPMRVIRQGIVAGAIAGAVSGAPSTLPRMAT